MTIQKLEMQAKDIMTKTNLITVKLDTLVSEVAELLHKHHFTGVPVVNDDNIIQGTISERDFITAGSDLYLPTYIKMLSGMDYVRGGKQTLPFVVQQIVRSTAKDIMNRKVAFATPETSLERIAEIFAVNRQNPIPITDTQNKLVGIIARSDLIKLFSLDHLESSLETFAKPKVGRAIDDQVAYTQHDFSQRFVYVTKFRANIWLVTGLVLFVIGFFAGITYVVDPNFYIPARAQECLQQKQV